MCGEARAGCCNNTLKDKCASRMKYEAAVWGEAAAGMRNGTDSWKWSSKEEGAPRFDQLNITRTNTEGIPAEIVDLLRGITMWEVWKARCNRIFNDREEGPRVVASRVWTRMITAAAARTLQLEKRGGRNGPEKAKKEAQIWHFLWKQGEAGTARDWVDRARSVVQAGFKSVGQFFQLRVHQTKAKDQS
ncbi:hypothetical protein SELMODRAFT_404937 [Selaginella moellendorffii]|uniref:Uncharacterized protein n=1 Tax=Selaginella moellendorffii TaxID=88036 RepID=D8QXV1_SELML|nr:hypothetical protein SELMODRAFT_404937 [Selaginella moellendorffii]